MTYEMINEILLDRAYTYMLEDGVTDADWDESVEEYWLMMAKSYIDDKEEGYELLLAEFQELA